MFQETEYQIDNRTGSLYDVDVAEPNFWVGVSDYSDDHQSLIFESSRIVLPEKLKFPQVRTINEKMTLVINSRTDKDVKNGWIIDSEGEIKSIFYAGDAIMDVVVTKDFTVVTYFDESFGSSGIESGRLAIFDLEGNLLYGYMSEFSSEAVFVMDCYAAALVKDNKVIFYPYTDFPLVLLDVEAKTQQIWEPPAEVYGSGAISKLGNRIYFHGPYRDKSGIYEWQIGSEKAQRVAEYSNQLRGLPQGRFLAQSDSGYTIISLQ